MHSKCTLQSLQFCETIAIALLSVQKEKANYYYYYKSTRGKDQGYKASPYYGKTVRDPKILVCASTFFQLMKTGCGEGGYVWLDLKLCESGTIIFLCKSRI